VNGSTKTEDVDLANLRDIRRIIFVAQLLDKSGQSLSAHRVHQVLAQSLKGRPAIWMDKNSG
jgi:hypothetical protein